MAMTIHLDIVSAEAEIFSGHAEMVIIPAVMGDVGITPRHAPLLSPMKKGKIRVLNNGEEEVFCVSGGMFEVQPHTITVLSDVAARVKKRDENCPF